MTVKKNDFILIGILLLIALAIFAAYKLFFGLDNSQGVISISYNSSSEIFLSLDEDATYIISTENDLKLTKTDSLPSDSIKGKPVNILVVKNHTAYMLDAGCPDLLCVHQASINKMGEQIVCLPNKLIISIKKGSPSDVDTIAS